MAILRPSQSQTSPDRGNALHFCLISISIYNGRLCIIPATDAQPCRCIALPSHLPKFLTIPPPCSPSWCDLKLCFSVAQCSRQSVSSSHGVKSQSTFVSIVACNGLLSAASWTCSVGRTRTYFGANRRKHFVASSRKTTTDQLRKRHRTYSYQVWLQCIGVSRQSGRTEWV